MHFEDVVLHFDVIQATLTSVIVYPVLVLHQYGVTVHVGVRDIDRAVDLDCGIARKLEFGGPRNREAGARWRRCGGESKQCPPFVLSKQELEGGKTGDEYTDAGLDHAPV